MLIACFTSSTKRCRSLSPATLPAPASGRAGSALKLVHEGQLEAALACAPPADAARLRSAGGPVAGLFLRALPSARETVFLDGEFWRAVSVQWSDGNVGKRVGMEKAAVETAMIS